MANKPLSRLQEQWVTALRDDRYITGMRSNTNSTGSALFRRGLAYFNYRYNRWVLTEEGTKYAYQPERRA